MTNPMLDAALDYATRGWAVVPILPGEKRPAIDRWTERATTDPDLIAAWWRTHPTHGVGIATGPISGFFVLDVDGPEGADTLRRLEAEHGELPHTYTVATGSGGAHYYFRAPAWEIRNDASKRLGPKLDIRGAGGQVVAPPTVHPNGTPYRWTHGDDPTDAPSWLLDLLRDATPEPDRAPATTIDIVSDRPGDRFNAATSWPQLLEADGWTHHHTDRTGEQHWTRPGKDRREGTSATVGYQGLDVLHIFTSSVKGLDPEATYSRFAYYTATRHGGDYVAASRELGAAQDAEALDAWLNSPQRAPLDDLTVPQTVTDVVDADQAQSLTETIAGRFLRGDAIEQLPPVEWLIDGVLEQRSVANLYGPSGHGKSFIALDMAASIVTGRTWHGHPTDEGTVLYVAAEGASGQGPRRRAWMTHYGADRLDDLVWYPEAVNLTSPLEVAAFTEAAGPLEPALVVFDTQARCSVGAEENSAKDMGLIVAACDQIVARLGCTVLLIHHAGKDAGAGMRGSTAVLGAMNTVLGLQRAGEHIVLTVEKQKNSDDGAKHSFQLVPSADSVVAIEVARHVDSLPDEMVELLRTIEEIDSGDGVTSSEMRTATTLAERTFYRLRKKAITDGYCHNVGSEKRARYALTNKGETALAWGVLPPTANPDGSKP